MNLYEYLEKNPTISMESKNKLTSDLLNAVFNLHQKQFDLTSVRGSKEVHVAHFDLKPTNLIIMDETPTLKIADFDSVLPINSTKNRRATPSHASPTQFHRYRTSDTSTAEDIKRLQACYSRSKVSSLASWYIERFPDMTTFIQENVDHASHSEDMWAVGLILVQIYTRLNPFTNTEIVFNLLTNQEAAATLWKDTPMEIRILIENLLHIDAYIRNEWTAEKILEKFNHYYKKTDMQALSLKL